MNSFSDKIKSAVIVGLVLSLGIVSSIRLMKIQIVGDEEIVAPKIENDNSLVYTRNTKATRGEIVDFSNNLIIGNSTQTDIIIHKAFFPEDLQKGNEILIQVYHELKNRGCEIKLSLPITETRPYVFLPDGDAKKLREDLNLNVYATAENCIDSLITDYEISDEYSDDDKRIIAGLRYEMMCKDFSYNNDFIIAENVDAESVIDLKEMSIYLRGIDAVESANREIIRGDILPHEIGTVGPIYAEQYESLKEQGYEMNDTLGKSGIELAMETKLRGQDGEEKVTVNNNLITDIDTISEFKPGETVKLTVNGTYQIKLQGILDNFINNFQSFNQKPELKDVHAGAIVVLDAKTGAVKGMVNAPTYNLKDYSEHYDELLKAEYTPLFNRATYGQYRPGSTFKTITATAGLNEGIVNGETTFTCNQKYFYIDTPYQCTGYHNDLAVTKALEVSCNIYFYELSQKLGIDNITKYAQLYGLGEHTGIETGDEDGYLANPETFVANGQPWYIGYVLQAAIGNIDCGMTPLQMACVANTIANEGVRYKPFLVDSLYEYGTDKVVSKTQPTVAAKIDLNYDYVYDYIEQGMIAASHNMPEKYSLSNLGFDVAIKTGTPQTGKKIGDFYEQNSFFIGYAPADDPQIAFAGVIEGGEYSKYMIRDIILAYQECYGLNGSKPTAVLQDPNNKPSAATTANTSASNASQTTSVSSTAAGGNSSSEPTGQAPMSDIPNDTVSMPPSTNVNHNEPQSTSQSE